MCCAALLRGRADTLTYEKEVLEAQVQELQRKLSRYTAGHAGESDTDEYIKQIKEIALGQQQELERQVYEFKTRAQMAETQLEEMNAYMTATVSEFSDLDLELNERQFLFSA